MSSSILDRPCIIALIGSFIVVVGQLAATVIPVWLGPDISDYSLVCNPVYHEISLNQTKTIEMVTGEHVDKVAPYNLTISAIGLHPLQPYSRQIFLTIGCPPGIIPSSFNPMITVDHPTFVTLWINMTHLRSNVEMAYPITIEGIGEDGKKRNSTAIVSWSTNDLDSMKLFVREDLLK